MEPKLTEKKAIVLLSGGIDSATTLAVALAEHYYAIALSFDYGQRHQTELDAAKKLGVQLGVPKHFIFPLELDQIGGSALTTNVPVPKKRTEEEIGHGIPPTYVPARNTIFLSIALAFAEVWDARTIFIGANVIDYSGYPDCRPEYLEAFEYMGTLGTKAGAEGHPIKIVAPLINLTKADIIQRAIDLGVEIGLTFSCYDPDELGLACGLCDACQIRRRGFLEAGVIDPTRYREAPINP